MSDFKEIYNSVVDGDVGGAQEAVEEALSRGAAPLDLVAALLEGIQYVGDEFKNGRYFVPEVMISARAMNAGMNLIRPHLSGGEDGSKGTVVIGTVEGDLHDIGKNLVAMMLEAGGYKVVNLGSDISAQGFADAVQAHQADILAMSALLTTTMLEMQDVIAALEDRGLRAGVNVIIGGAPLTQEFAGSIGADGYAYDASGAVDLCNRIMEGGRKN